MRCCAAAIKNRILYPADSKTKAALKKIKEDLYDEGELSQVSIELFGRKVSFLKGHKNMLVTDFLSYLSDLWVMLSM